jgi:hypothetical protein
MTERDPAPPPDRLERTLLAVLAAWLVPGLGHVLLGRIRRGLVFSFLVLASFGLGLAHDGRIALRDDRQPLLSTLQVVANLGVGPADLIARWAVYGGVPYSVPRDPFHPSRERLLGLLRERTRSSLSIYGTAYLWTAGLMNLLLLFDVWDIGRGRKL